MFAPPFYARGDPNKAAAPNIPIFTANATGMAWTKPSTLAKDPAALEDLTTVISKSVSTCK